MTPDERSALLAVLRGLGIRGAEQVDPWPTFLVLLAHRRALRRDCVVVLGARGAGKTSLFNLVQRTSGARLREFLDEPQIPDATWIDAFSQTGLAHPEVGALERIASGKDASLRVFWAAHLLRRLCEHVAPPLDAWPELGRLLEIPVGDVDAWLALAVAHAGRLTAALDALESSLRARDQIFVAAYDNLDRIAQFDPQARRRFVSALLSLWLSLSDRYRQIRGKIFLRIDLFDASELLFPDANKLRPRAVSLDWDREALFRLLLRHLGADPGTRTWLSPVRGLGWRDRGEFGWHPGELDERAQQALAARIAGHTVGQGVLKTPTATWVVSRIGDAHGRITPRAFLWFFAFAAEHAPTRKARGRLLDADDLLAALRRTSRERTTELQEEYPWVARLENLRACALPLARADALARLARRRADEAEGTPEDGESLLSEMLRLGVVRAHGDAAIDLPDIYRYPFELTPNYAHAWRGYIESAGSDHIAQLVRELPDISRILKDMPWHEVGMDKLADANPDTALEQIDRALELAEASDNHSAQESLLLKRLFLQARAHRPLQVLRETCDRLLIHKGRATTGAQADEFKAQVFILTELEYPSAPEICATKIAAALRMLPGSPTNTRERALGYLRLGLAADELSHKESARIFLEMALIVDPALQTELSSVRATLEESISPRTDEHRARAREGYERDRGFGLIRETFPDIPL